MHLTYIIVFLMDIMYLGLGVVVQRNQCFQAFFHQYNLRYKLLVPVGVFLLVDNEFTKGLDSYNSIRNIMYSETIVYM